MFPIRLALASRSANLDFVSLSKAANAINLQVTRDFAPIWGVNATVIALEHASSIPPGVWPVYILDQVGGDHLGFHLDDHNQPSSQVLYGPTWSLTASHECLEMLADPSANRLVSSSSVAIVDNEIRDGVDKFEYLVEVCDPCEDDSCAYLVDDVLVSDFYTPRYFDPVASSGVRYCFSGKITRPRQILPNGYLSWINPVTRTLQQAKAFGAPEIVDLGPINLTPGAGVRALTLRAIVDRQTPPPIHLSNLNKSAPIVEARAQRAAFLASAGPARGLALEASRPRPPAVAAAANAEPVLDAPAIDQFAKPGVLSVRPGWRFVSGWITGERGVVATVRPEALDALAAALPAEIRGVPVDVRPANALETFAVDSPQEQAVTAEARHELRLPEFGNQVFFDAIGRRVEPTPPAQLLAAARPAKPEIPYAAPGGVTLDAVIDDFTMVLCASPDAGWDKLSEFLTGVEHRLVVGMYDFTSAHVLAAVEDALIGKQLTLTLDHPARNPTANQTDQQTQADLDAKLGGGFKGAWALTRGDPMASSWIFPTAYHIKVAVRDEDDFWLSSGNWNNSNQPEIDLSDMTAAIKIATQSDRDWHVIVTNTALADVFRAFLENDYAVASAHDVTRAAAALAAAVAAPALPSVTALSVPEAVVANGRTPRKFFQPTTVTGNFKVQPLLTPDNYQANVLDLIKSAHARFYMQTQYIHPGVGPADQLHDDLIAAVQDRIAAGVDVRLITSEYETAAWIEQLKNAGLDVSKLRIQPKVHNKGIVVDSATVMISSQNWSADGTLRNRDAGLIIHSPDAAAYFEAIFLSDWNTLAAQRVVN
jgi:hypothetical protein